MIQCDNCQSYVSADYVRVFVPEEYDRPRACPNCEDMIRDASGVREKKT